MEVEDRSMDGELFLQIITLAEEFFVQLRVTFPFHSKQNLPPISYANITRIASVRDRDEHRYKNWEWNEYSKQSSQ